MALSRTILGILGSAVMLLSMTPITAQAQPAYSLRNAEYVSTSQNVEVLRYIVCLEDQVARLPRRLDIVAALDNAAFACRDNAARLPRGRNEPTANDIRAAILECGFRPGDAAPDMGCGTPADEIVAQPTIIDTGKWLEAVAYDGDSFWAAESGQRTIARIDFSTHRVSESYKVGRLPVDISVGDRGEAFALVATDKVIKRLDRRGGATTLATLGGYPEAMVFSGDQLWVLASPDGSSQHSNLVRVDTRTGAQRSTGDLGEWATSLVATEDEVWVSHARNGGVSIVDKRSLRDARISLPGAEIWKLASDFSFVYGGGRVEGSADDGLLIKINPLSRQETGRVLLPEMIREVATDGTFVFAVGKTGTIWIVSATDMKLLRTVKPTTLGASYAPTSALVVEDLLMISARQFFGLDGAEIKDRRGEADENGAILLFANIVPDGAFEMTQRPTPTSRPSPNTFSPPGPRPTGAGNLPNRPGANAGQAAFPVVAVSRGGNVRDIPSVNGRKIGSTGDGQPVTLLENTGQLYNGYPWFKIRMANGIIGYQWGGGTCAKPQTPVAGTTGACARSTTGSRPNGNSGAATSPKTDEIDLAISMIDLFGKIVSGASTANGTDTPSNIFTQTLNVPPNGQGVIASRSVAQNQVVIYSVKGREGQTLDVSVWSPSQNAVFEIYIGQAADGGATLPGAAQGANTQAMREALPADADYKIVVGSVNGTIDFQLAVALEPARRPHRGPNAASMPNLQGIAAPTSGAASVAAPAEGMPQYDHVQPDQQQYCLSFAAPGADPRDDASYNDCMAQSEMDALESQEDAGGGAGMNEPAVDLNPGGAYSDLPQDVLDTCHGDTDCLEAGVSQASRAFAQGVDNIIASEFSDLTDEDVRLCEAVEYGSQAFYDCLGNVRADKSSVSNDQAPGWDRAKVLYLPAHEYCAGDLELDASGTDYANCYFAYPNY